MTDTHHEITMHIDNDCHRVTTEVIIAAAYMNKGAKILVVGETI